MMETAVLSLQWLACLGLGMTMLRILRIDRDLRTMEYFLWSAAMGIGILGWLMFYFGVLGLISPGWLSGLLLISSLPTIIIFRNLGLPTKFFVLDKPVTGLVLFSGILIIGLFDFVEALAPPADADTLAYHFALPKYFIDIGRLEFVPRALDGAIPLLVQMTYIPPLALGGERALTLWTMTTGWLAAALIYVTCLRYMSWQWSLAVSIVFLSTPAVVYGAGSGQVEIRNSLFVLVAALSVAESVRTGNFKFAILAGLASGFFVGGKYTGLIFAFSAGLTLLAQRRWLVSGISFSIALLVAGGQWYAWNFAHSGDPIFPMLYGVLEYFNDSYWDAAHHATLQSVWASEKALSLDIFSFLIYPFAATLADLRALESSRTGFGPLALLMLPFALGGIWRFREKIITSRLTPIATIALIFYAVWFFSGSSQRLRHLLPIYPLLLICMTVTAHKWAESKNFIKPLAGAVVVSGIIQFVGFGIFSVNYLTNLIRSESRESFLHRNVSQFAPVPWINKNLDKSNRLYVYSRQLIYYIDVPTHYGHFVDDALIDIQLLKSDPKHVFEQLKTHNISHILMIKQTNSSYGHRMAQLFDAGCFKLLKNFEIKQIRSRTLRLGSDNGTIAEIFFVNRLCSLK